MSLDDEVLKYFPEDAPAEPSANLKAMRVRDLLRMATGNVAEASFTPNDVWTKAFLSQPVPFKPGTHFLYNSTATYMLSAIVQKATGIRTAGGRSARARSGPESGEVCLRTTREIRRWRGNSSQVTCNN